MVATDTIVGIVGAVLLIGVMTGVFVYEYNNTDTTADGDGGDGDADFHAMYPTLAADEDLDGDGTPNAEDDDIDGDGTPNAEDQDVSATFTMDGSVGPTGVATSSLTFFAGTNNTRIEAIVTGSPTLDNPAASDFTVDLLGPDGDVVATGPGNGGETYTLTVDGGAAPGEYTLRVSTPPTSLGGAFHASVTVTY